MELVSSPKPKLTTILSESRRLIKSHRRCFSAIFLAFLFIGLLSLIPSFCIAGDGDSVPNGDDDNIDMTRLTQFMTVRTFLISLVYRIFNTLAAISVTSVALQSFKGKSALSLNSVAKSIRASFFPLIATHLLQLAIIFLVLLGATIFGCVVLFAFVFGFQVIDPNFPFFQFVAMGFIGVPSLLVVAYLFVSWGMVTPVVMAESTWGFAALKRSKSLVNGNRSLAIILVLLFAVPYNIVELLRNHFYAVDGLEEKKSFVAIMALLFVAQLVVTSMINLYEIVVFTLFYVFCKAVHEEGLNGDSQYVKLAVDDCEKVGK